MGTNDLSSKQITNDTDNEGINIWMPDKQLQQATLEVMKTWTGYNGHKTYSNPIISKNTQIFDITKDLAAEVYQGGKSKDQDYGLFRNKGIKNLTGFNYIGGLFIEGGDLSGNDISDITPLSQKVPYGYFSEYGFYTLGKMNFDGNHIVSMTKAAQRNFDNQCFSFRNQVRDYGQIDTESDSYTFENPIQVVGHPVNGSDIMSISVDGIETGRLDHNDNKFKFDNLSYGRHKIEIQWRTNKDYNEDGTLVVGPTYWFTGKLKMVLNRIKAVKPVTVNYLDQTTGKKSSKSTVVGTDAAFGTKETITHMATRMSKVIRPSRLVTITRVLISTIQKTQIIHPRTSRLTSPRIVRPKLSHKNNRRTIQKRALRLMRQEIPRLKVNKGGNNGYHRPMNAVLGD